MHACMHANRQSRPYTFLCASLQGDRLIAISFKQMRTIMSVRTCTAQRNMCDCPSTPNAAFLLHRRPWASRRRQVHSNPSVCPGPPPFRRACASRRTGRSEAVPGVHFAQSGQQRRPAFRRVPIPRATTATTPVCARLALASIFIQRGRTCCNYRNVCLPSRTFLVYASRITNPTLICHCALVYAQIRHNIQCGCSRKRCVSQLKISAAVRRTCKFRARDQAPEDDAAASPSYTCNDDQYETQAHTQF